MYVTRSSPFSRKPASDRKWFFTSPFTRVKSYTFGGYWTDTVIDELGNKTVNGGNNIEVYDRIFPGIYIRSE